MNHPYNRQQRRWSVSEVYLWEGRYELSYVVLNNIQTSGSNGQYSQIAGVLFPDELDPVHIKHILGMVGWQPYQSGQVLLRTGQQSASHGHDIHGRGPA